MNTGLLRHAVATVLTVYGIETIDTSAYNKGRVPVATVLTVYGIETFNCSTSSDFSLFVATVLTVYGIETPDREHEVSAYLKLQQCLPFTVLKPDITSRYPSAT